MVSVLALVICLQEESLTLQQAGIPLDRMLARIGGLMGQVLECSETLRSDVVALGVKDAPTGEVLEKIAEVTAGRWTAIPGGQRLVADDAKTKMRQAQFLAEETDFFRQGFAKAKLAERYDEAYVTKLFDELASLKLPEDYGAREEMLKPYRYEAPVERMRARIAEAIGPEVFAAMAPGERLVFSNRPTSLQRPLPAAAAQAVGQYAVEAELASRIKSARPTPVPEENLGTGLGYIEVPKQGEAVLVHVIVDRHPHAVYIHVESFDTQGTPIIKYTSGSITPHYMDALPLRRANPLPDLEGQVAYSEAAQSWNEHVTWTNPKNPVPPPSVRAAFGGGADPLGFGPSELGMAAAEQKGLNFIALLPDAVGSFSWEGSATQALSSQLMRLANNSYGTKVRADDKWLVFEPKNLAHSRRTRMDRQRLTNLVAEIERTGEMPVESVLAVMETLETDAETQFLFSVIRPFLGAGKRRERLTGELDPLLFISRLRPEARRRLMNEGRVEVNWEALGEAAQNQFWRLIESFPYLDDSAEKPEGHVDWDDRDYDFENQYIMGQQTPWREPTFTLAQREAGPAVITITMARQDSFSQTPGSSDNGEYLGRATMQAIARTEAYIRYSPTHNPYNAKHNLYALEPVARFEIRVQFGPRFSYRSGSYLNLRPGQTEYMGVGEFQGDLKRRFEQAVKAELDKLNRTLPPPGAWGGS